MTPTEKLQQLKLRSDKLQSKRTKLQQEISDTVIEIYKQHIKYKELKDRVRIAPRKFEEVTYKVGYVEHVVNFKDEDTGEDIFITLHRNVWVDGEWRRTQDMEFCLTHLIEK